MATATPPANKNAVYPKAEVARLLAPPEQEQPSAKAPAVVTRSSRPQILRPYRRRVTTHTLRP